MCYISPVQIIPELGVPVSENLLLSDIPMLERARLACNTVNEICGQAPEKEISEIEKCIARDTFEAITVGRTAPAMSSLAVYPNESLRYLDRMLSEYDHELVNSAVRIREFTKNKLLVEAENPDGKIRIRALELLGKMKDVGLFTDRIEITNKTRTDEELETELTKKLERYMGSALVVEDMEEDSASEEDTLEEVENTENAEDTPEIDKLDAFIGRLGAETPPLSGSEHLK